MAMEAKQYALYKGDIILAVGTRKEIAEELGISKETVDSYAAPRHLRRAKSENVRTLIAIDERTEDMNTECFAYAGKPGMHCTALNVTSCGKGSCAFFKTKDKKKADDLKSKQRIRRIYGPDTNPEDFKGGSI